MNTLLTRFWNSKLDMPRPVEYQTGATETIGRAHKRLPGAKTLNRRKWMRLNYLAPIAIVTIALTAGCTKQEEPAPAPANGVQQPMPGGPPQPGGPPMPGGPPPKGAVAKGDTTAGKTVFQANCARCHGDKGEGRRPGMPNFSNAAWQKQQNDAELLGVIHNGKERMPKFAGRLSEKEITDVEAYVRTLAAAK